MLTPRARGSLSEALFEAMRSDAATLPRLHAAPDHDEDAEIALWALYELHYRGFDDVAEDREWDPALLELRRSLERRLEARLRARFAPPEPSDSFAETFFDFVAGHDGASLAAYIHRQADVDEARDLLRLRSVYHLKESDPTAWVVPRLPARVQAPLMEIQYDEYGAGDPNRLHAGLFATGMEACGLSRERGAYLDEAPLEVLEQNNAMSLFGLHRRLRGAALGHLAAFEATSSLPSRRMAQGLARLGLADEMVAYYQEHVAADAVHEQLAVRAVCANLLDEEPGLESDVYFGAFTALDLEDRFARLLLERWRDSAKVSA